MPRESHWYNSHVEERILRHSADNCNSRMKWTPFLLRPRISIVRPSSNITIRITATLRRREFANAATMPSQRDPTTLSNYGAWRTKHTSVDFKLDFDNKRLKGSVTLQLESQTDKESKEIVLDAKYVKVDSVSVAGAASKWELKPHSDPFGSPLHVAVPEGAAKGDIVDVTIEVETTDKCTALQWLTPAQTSNKKHPYVFSQCQAICARSIFPCQDTPDVKSTFSFKIRSILPTVASGCPVGDHTPTPGTEKVYEFEQKVPIPSYLFAIGSGDVESAKIGCNSCVVTGPEELASCKWELESDMDKFMAAAEKIVFPYRWGEYNVLVLPPSFPYGGMENPIYTFATPTVISGDKQNIDVIAHELAHSWSGNLVSNASWEHFWLNEGWTVYLERRIIAELHGPAAFDFSAIIGWRALENAVEQFGADHEYTKLIIDHKGVDPEDVYSTVAYEKGFHFLYYLDRLVGREAWNKFIPFYFTKWSGKSLDSFEFRDTFLDYFNGLGDESIKEKIATIDWDAHFYTPGMPEKPKFDTSMVDICYELAAKWNDASYEPKASDVENFSGNQKLVFLGELDKDGALSAERAAKLGAVYDFISSKNVEIKAAYYSVALRAGDATAAYGTAELLGTVGRMKFVRPLYRALFKANKDLAVETFAKNKDFYHPIARGLVEKDFKL